MRTNTGWQDRTGVVARIAAALFAGYFLAHGATAFLTLVLGALVVIAAIAVELTLHPPLWLHMLVWTPLTAIGVVWSLRLAKAALLASEYRNDAREHRS